MEEQEYLHDWVFHFNPYRKVWYGIPRDSYLDYWQHANEADVLKSSNIDTILDILHKVKGDVTKIKSLIKS